MVPTELGHRISVDGPLSAVAGVGTTDMRSGYGGGQGKELARLKELDFCPAPDSPSACRSLPTCHEPELCRLALIERRILCTRPYDACRCPSGDAGHRGAAPGAPGGTQCQAWCRASQLLGHCQGCRSMLTQGAFQEGLATPEPAAGAAECCERPGPAAISPTSTSGGAVAASLLTALCAGPGRAWVQRLAQLSPQLMIRTVIPSTCAP